MRTDRLLKLADFLDNMPEEKFNFSVIAKEDGKPMLEALAAGHTKCGTVGCAIGWMPVVFPESFKWNKLKPWSVELSVISAKGGINFDAAADFFEIDLAEADYLFMPSEEENCNDGNSGLLSTASPKQVATHIRKFITNAN